MFRIRIIFLPSPTFVSYIFKVSCDVPVEILRGRSKIHSLFSTRLFHVSLNVQIDFLCGKKNWHDAWSRLWSLLDFEYISDYNHLFFHTNIRIMKNYICIWYQLMIIHYMYVNIFDSKNFKFRNISQSANIFENTIIKV